MKTKYAVMATDTINKYNMKFAAGSLEDPLRQKWSTGVPMHISHDIHRPIGWSVPISIYAEPNVTKLIGLIQIPENNEESNTIYSIHNRYINREHYKNSAPFKTELDKKVSGYLTPKAKLLSVGCAAYFDKNIAVKIFKDLFEKTDDDGLLKINNLKHIGSGIFEIDGLAIFAHSYFRRSFSIFNNINHHFFDYLDELLSKNIEIKIALDPNLIGLASSYKFPVELEYWWGPKFENHLTNIKNGLTHYEGSENDKLFFGITSTQFWWYSRKGEKTLEIEEMRDQPVPFLKNKYACRYIHSIVDETKNEIVHLDGSVRIYDDELMIERLDADLSKFGKKTEYFKLWRIDNNFKIAVWKRVISDYFRDNHLIGEYFGAKDKLENVKSITQQASLPKNTTLQECVPYTINAGDGIRINFSYHTKLEVKTEIEVFPIDSFHFENKVVYYIEHLALELKKDLFKKGYNLFIPENIKYLAFEDSYLNLPLIVFKSNDHKVISATLDSIYSIIKWYYNNKRDAVVSFTLSIPLEDREMRISIFGHVNDLIDWFNESKNKLPVNENDIKPWIENSANFLSKYPDKSSPDIMSLLKQTGILLIDRVQIQNEIEYNFKYSNETKSLVCEMKFPKSMGELHSLVISKTIDLAPCILIKKVICNKCKQDYLNCGCSILNGETYKEMKDFQILFNFWTNRKC